MLPRIVQAERRVLWTIFVRSKKPAAPVSARVGCRSGIPPKMGHVLWRPVCRSSFGERLLGGLYRPTFLSGWFLPIFFSCPVPQMPTSETRCRNPFLCTDLADRRAIGRQGRVFGHHTRWEVGDEGPNERKAADHTPPEPTDRGEGRRSQTSRMSSAHWMSLSPGSQAECSFSSWTCTVRNPTYSPVSSSVREPATS